MLACDDRMVGLADGERLARQLETQGFLILPCHEPLWQAIQALWVVGARFFALPQERKARNVMAVEYDGYHDIGQEFSCTPDRPDLAEAFWARLINVGKSCRLPDPEAGALHRAALDVACELELLLTRLTAALARHYAPTWVPEHVFGCEKASHLQFNHYQPRSQTRDLLQDPHEDGLYFTLWRADAPGLEVRGPDGAWQPVRLGPRELLAMPGEIFSLLCGWRVPPLYHLIRNHPEIERRFSMMYFSNPNPDHALRPWIENAANAGVDIVQRAISNPTRYGLPPLPPV
jgi:isopenicillin N synthase-like dioxygenase